MVVARDNQRSERVMVRRSLSVSSFFEDGLRVEEFHTEEGNEDEEVEEGKW